MDTKRTCMDGLTLKAISCPGQREGELCALHDAAPELFVQLKKAVECLHGLNRFDLEPMKAAIAKAEGRHSNE